MNDRVRFLLFTGGHAWEECDGLTSLLPSHHVVNPWQSRKQMARGWYHLQG